MSTNGKGAPPAADQRARLILFALSAVLLLVIAVPIWRPLLLAAVLAGAASDWHDRAARRLGGRRTVSAALFTIALVVLILLPIGGLAVLIAQQVIELVSFIQNTLQHKGVGGLVAPLPDGIEQMARRQLERLAQTPRELLSRVNVWSRAGWAAGALLGVASSTAHLLFSLVLMLIGVFFLLRDGRSLLRWLERRMPGGQPLANVLGDMREVSRSLLTANVATGAAQSVVATIGYLISGVPSPWLLGLLTFMASFVPSVGVALIGVPAIGLLLLLGKIGWAIFLLAWIALVAGLIDNLLRPLLMRGSQQLSAALLFFALTGGALLFGAIGLVAGPLILSGFIAATRQLGHEDAEGV